MIILDVKIRPAEGLISLRPAELKALRVLARFSADGCNELGQVFQPKGQSALQELEKWGLIERRKPGWAGITKRGAAVVRFLKELEG